MPAGTWNLGRIRKTADYIGLKDLSSISINDDSTTSDQFFNIVEFPTTLTGGKNLFKIKANTNTLVRDSTIYIEILDSNGNPIYHEPVNYLEADGTRVIAVYIYPDTPYGTATVYIAGRAKYNPITGIQLRHSQNINDLNYYNSPNVLWKRSVTTAPERLNSTEIIFTKKPILNVREVVQPYLQPVNLTNVATQSNGLGTCVIRPRPQSISTNTAILQGPAAAATTQGSFTRNSPPSAMGTQIPVSPLANAISTAGNISTTPALNANNIPFTLSSTSIVTAIDESIFETSTPFFSSDMNQGDIITVVNPNVDCTYGAKSKYGVVFPASQFNIKTSYSNVSGIQPLSGSYRFVIDIILSTTKAHVVLLDGFKKIADNNTGGKWQVELDTIIADKNGPTLGGTELNSHIEATANYTCSYTLPFVLSSTEQSQSFAEIRLADIEPDTGDVYKVRTYYKPGGMFGDYVDAGETILEQLEVLEDTSSFEGRSIDGAGYNRIGFFSSLSDYQTYFEESNGAIAPTNLITPTFEPDDLMSGIRLSSAGDNITDDFGYVHIKSSYRPELSKNTQYIISINAYSDLFNTSTDPSIANKPQLDIYISGSSGTITPDPRTMNGFISTEFSQYETSLTGNFADNGPFGTRVGSLQPTPSSSIVPALFRFESSEAQNVDIYLVQRNGRFNIGNLSLKTFNESKFTPNFTRINTRIPTQYLNTPLSFKFKFYDYLSNIAETEAIIYPINFTGENMVIGGMNNLLTGAVYIGNVVGSGIELAGSNSGFIRTIGYEGFTSGSQTNKPGGFMMWSGSVLPNAPDDYTGVGLELLHDSSSYFKFRTKTGSSAGAGSILDIRTDTFFLGSEDTSFISGSGDGTIAISSSNFELTNTGDVTMQGTITATAGGTIGGATIESASLAFAPYWRISASADATDPVSFISSSAFKVSADGRISASSALFSGSVSITGDVNAKTGTIGGFRITADAITGSQFFLSGSAIDNQFFISSSKFNVKASGDITGSQVLFTGGKIAGWNIDTEKISNTGVHLSSSYGLKVFDGVDDGLDFVEMKYKAADNWGLLGKESGQEIFQLGNKNQIASWSFDNTKIISNMGVNSPTNPGIVIKSEGTIETDPFISGLTANATGWQIRADGRAEFENAVIRGTLSTAVFEKDTISVVGGQVMIANAAKVDNVNPRFTDYPYLTGSNGENINYSGEELPANEHTGSYSNSGTNLPSTTANNVHESDLWFKITNNVAATQHWAPAKDIDTDANKIYRVTFYQDQGDVSSPMSFRMHRNGVGAEYSKATMSFNGAAWDDDSNHTCVDGFNYAYFKGEQGSATSMTMYFIMGTDTVSKYSYIRDIHAMEVSQSLTVDNAGGFIQGEYLVAKSTDQGPDGREGFVREYMQVLSTTLGSSDTPASGTFDFSNATIDTATNIFVTASKKYTFTGVTSPTTDQVADNQYYFVLGSSKGESLINLKNKIVEEVLDIFAMTTGSNPGALDQIYFQGHGVGSDGNAYGVQSGSTQVTLEGGLDRTKPTLTVERNMDALVSGNERGYWIDRIKDGQSMASQGAAGTGYILLNAQPTDTSTPYIDIVERQDTTVGSQQHTGDDANSVFGEVTTLARIGDLSGITDYNFSDGVSGYGIYTSNGYFKGKVEVSSLPITPPSENLIFHLPLDGKVLSGSQGSGSFPDLSGNNYHDNNNYVASNIWAGKSVTVNSASAKIGGSAVFTATDGDANRLIYKNIPLRDNHTFAAWVKIDSSDTSQLLFAIDANSSYTNPFTGGSLNPGTGGAGYNGQLDLWFTGNTIMWNTGDSWSNPFRTQGNTADVSWQQYNNTWTHFAVVNNSSTLSASLYINGKLTGSAAYRNPTTDAGVGDLTVGGYVYSSATNYNFKGEIDDFRIYTGSLSSNQVESIYLSPDSGTGRTIISGDSISTGHLRSNNWGPSFGSEFNLNSGTFKLGGSTDPKLSWNGTTLAVTGDITVSNPDSFYMPNKDKADYRIALIVSASADPTPGSRVISSSLGYTNYVETTTTGSQSPADILNISSSGYDLYVFSDEAWNVESEQMAMNLFDEGHSVFVQANNMTTSNITGSGGTDWPVKEHVTVGAGEACSYENGHIATGSGMLETDPMGQGWSVWASTATNDTGNYPRKVYSDGGGSIYTPIAISGSIPTISDTGNIATNTTAGYIAFYGTNPRGGRIIISTTRYNLIKETPMERCLDFLLKKDLEQESYQQGITTITGNMVSTGKIQSTNLSTTAGTEIDLDGETIKIGGTDAEYDTGTGIYMEGSTGNAPKFKVGDASSDYLKYDTTNGLRISGDITVSNPDSFYMPNKTRASYKLAYIDSGSSESDPNAEGFTMGKFFSSSLGYVGGNFGTTLVAPNNMSEPDAVPGNTWFSVVTASVKPADIVGYATNGYDLFVAAARGYGTDLSAEATKILNLFDEGNSVLIWGNGTSTINATGSHGTEWPIKKREPMSFGTNPGSHTGSYATSSIYDTGLHLNNPILQGWGPVWASTEDWPGEASNPPTRLYSDGGATTVVPIAARNIAADGDLRTNTTAQYLAWYATNPRGGRMVCVHGPYDAYNLYTQNPVASERIIDFLLKKDLDQEAYQSGITKITGDMIQTGLIQSTNLSSTVGSEFDLDAGTIKLGGNGSGAPPNFAVNAQGDVTASNALFDGIATAVNFNEKLVIVNTSNSSSYFADYNNNAGVRLLFDGSGGGDITMNMQLDVAPWNTVANAIKPIQSILTPTTTDGLKTEITLLINTDSVRYDDSEINSSYYGGGYAS